MMLNRWSKILCRLLIGFFFLGSVFAQELIPDFSPESVAVLNEEFRKIRDDIDDKGFFDRGDPASDDWTQADLTTDATWRDLDLSAIVPAGAKAVLFSVGVKDGVVDSDLRFRKNGNTDIYNRAIVRTLVANVYTMQDIVVACDTDRIIEYNGDNLTFTNINIVVKGWWL